MNMFIVYVIKQCPSQAYYKNYNNLYTLNCPNKCSDDFCIYQLYSSLTAHVDSSWYQMLTLVGSHFAGKQPTVMPYGEWSQCSTTGLDQRVGIHTSLHQPNTLTLFCKCKILVHQVGRYLWDWSGPVVGNAHGITHAQQDRRICHNGVKNISVLWFEQDYFLAALVLQHLDLVHQYQAAVLLYLTFGKNIGNNIHTGHQNQKAGNS